LSFLHRFGFLLPGYDGLWKDCHSGVSVSLFWIVLNSPLCSRCHCYFCVAMFKNAFQLFLSNLLCQGQPCGNAPACKGFLICRSRTSFGHTLQFYGCSQFTFTRCKYTCAFESNDRESVEVSAAPRPVRSTTVSVPANSSSSPSPAQPLPVQSSSQAQPKRSDAPNPNGAPIPPSQVQPDSLVIPRSDPRVTGLNIPTDTLARKFVFCLNNKGEGAPISLHFYHFLCF
jgi:ssDNA-binding Zn-finger/Zn-ribbon topoisomerase 1